MLAPHSDCRRLRLWLQDIRTFRPVVVSINQGLVRDFRQDVPVKQRSRNPVYCYFDVFPVPNFGLLTIRLYNTRLKADRLSGRPSEIVYSAVGKIRVHASLKTPLFARLFLATELDVLTFAAHPGPSFDSVQVNYVIDPPCILVKPICLTGHAVMAFRAGGP
jgi:hypothetical protein